MSKRKSFPETGNLFENEEQADDPTLKQEPPFPPDQEFRRRALDITRSWIIEAPAGSGKTGLLIQRYLKLLADPKVLQPDQVLAITFTLKAAGEIRDRVIRELTRATTNEEAKNAFATETLELAAAVLERDKRFGWGILEQPRQLNIRTIDSICAEIARGLPLLSGGGALRPIEDAASLHQAAAERTLLLLGGSDAKLTESLTLLLLHRDGDLQRSRDLLAEMLSLREQWGRLIPLDRESLDDNFLDRSVLPELERTLTDAICEELGKLERLFPASALQRLTLLTTELGEAPGYRGGPSPLTICSGRHAVPGSTIADLQRWRCFTALLLKQNENDGWRVKVRANHIGVEITKGQREELEDILSSLHGNDRLLRQMQKVRKLPPATYPEDQWRVAKALFHVLYRALVELQIVFAERSECDFAELSLLARSALQHGIEDTDSGMTANLQHILIDEMQDTSTSQYELIQLLTRGWDGFSQTLFLVGDPKQSIYLFRQARVERFIRTKQERRIGELPLEPLQLTANFRSQETLVDSFNQIFSLLFPLAESFDKPDEAPYVSAEATRTSSSVSQASAIWHTQVINANTDEDEEDALQMDGLSADDEAEEIRRIIEHWRAKPLPEGREKPWRIAVLVRNRSHLTQIVKELKHNSGAGPIPFRAVNIEPLSERLEVLDLFALTRSLLHPADRVAWLSVLRAPWCGLDLNDLHILCGQDDHDFERYTVSELIQARCSLLSEDGRRRLEHVERILTAAEEKRSRVALPELVERTWLSLGGHLYLTEEERSNVEQYLELLNEIDQQESVIDLNLLKHHLKALFASPSTESDAVDLMTIHGSKGLEWDVVLLPGLEKRSHADSQRLLVWDELSTGSSGSEVILAPIAGKGQDSQALNEWIRAIHKGREDAECKRLFYVACTRAREELHLFAAMKRNRNGSLNPTRGTLLAAAWPAAEEHFINSKTAAKPIIAPIVTLPDPTRHQVLPAIAANASANNDSSAIQRLPESVFKSSAFFSARSLKKEDALSHRLFDRSEGTFESRAFGNAVHAFLKIMADAVRSGSRIADVKAELLNWSSRIVAILRSYGLSPATAQRLTPRVQTALTNTLSDPTGVWLLEAHAYAESEHALTIWNEHRSSIRLDRIFRSGHIPMAEGEDFLWIVDFKTASAPDAQSDFAKQERQRYGSQLETYARLLHDLHRGHVRVALYYPLEQQLIWWIPETIS